MAADRQPQLSFLKSLCRQASHRWLIFAIGLGLLLWLWFAAGQVRQPGAIKRRWAVVASRALVVAGAIFLARIVLVTHEERVPVVFVSAGKAGIAPEELIARAGYLHKHGYEDIPIDDVVMFIREARYVPKKCFAIVLEIDDLRGMSILTNNSPHLTVMTSLEALQSGSERVVLPYAITPAVRIRSASDLLDQLDKAKRLGKAIFDKDIECALIESIGSEAMRRLARRSGYLCFFDGQGFNRFGDEPHLVRLLDLTRLFAEGSGFKIWVSIQLFKGRFAFWPLAVITGLARDWY